MIAVPGRSASTAAFLLAVLSLTGACSKPSTDSKSPIVAGKVSVRRVNLFFETPQLLLGAETRNLPLPENDAAALTPTLRELIRGSANAAVPNAFPPDVVVKGAYLLENGTAVVDLGGPTLINGWSAGSHEEMMATFSIVQTLTANFPAVKRVRLLVNGQGVETLAGHIAIDRPLAPLPSLLASR